MSDTMTDSPASDDGRELEDLLSIGMAESVFEKTPYEFLPRLALDRIIEERSIFTAMGITQPTEEDKSLGYFISTRAKKAFATALYCELRPGELRNAMALFQKYSFDDNKLPIQAWSGDQFKDNPKKGTLHLFVSMEGPSKNGYGKIWTLRKIKGFQGHQWKFLAPVISTAEPNHNLGELTVPFIKKHAKFDEGSFGVVSKYEIHGDHIIDPSRPVSMGSVAAYLQTLR